MRQQPHSLILLMLRVALKDLVPETISDAIGMGRPLLLRAEIERERLGEYSNRLMDEARLIRIQNYTFAAHIFDSLALVYGVIKTGIAALPSHRELTHLWFLGSAFSASIAIDARLPEEAASTITPAISFALVLICVHQKLNGIRRDYSNTLHERHAAGGQVKTAASPEDLNTGASFYAACKLFGNCSTWYAYQKPVAVVAPPGGPAFP